MRVLVTGAKGQLGHDVVAELNRRGMDVIGVDVDEMDITDANSVDSVLSQAIPDAVIHCAAWTAVDAAEESENLERVYAVNVEGTKNVAEICKRLGCRMMYISTDYVFNGQGIEPWHADCKEYEPLSVYGKTKLEGELAVAKALTSFFIVRIAWAFGINGKNFVKTMLHLSDKYESLRVVNDQIGTPTYTHDLSRLLVDMIQTEKYGYYHATNEGGFLSWADFAMEIFRQADKKTKVIEVTTEVYGVSKAKRPQNSRLDKSKLVQNGFEPLPSWQDALARFLKELRKQNGKI